MVCCAVANCKNNNKNKSHGKKIRYFTFPKDLQLSRKWFNICQRKDIFNVETARICSEHFALGDYLLKYEVLDHSPTRKQLKSGAIPSLKLPSSIVTSIKHTTSTISASGYRLKKGNSLTDINKNYKPPNGQRKQLKNDDTNSTASLQNHHSEELTILPDNEVKSTYREINTPQFNHHDSIHIFENVAKNENCTTPIAQIMENETSPSNERMDVELIISEVEKRPVIWDVNEQGYKDKMMTNEAWNNVCAAFYPDYWTKTKAEQIVIAQDIISKWRSVRDNYVRYLKRQSDSKTGKRSGYIYEKHLTFLKKAKEACLSEENTIEYDGIDIKNEIINFENCNDELAGVSSEGSMQNFNPSYQPESISPKPPPAKKAKKLNFEERLIDVLETNLARKWPDNDEDMAFFISMMPTVKHLNTYNKFQFRIQVMQLLQTFAQAQDLNYVHNEENDTS